MSAGVHIGNEDAAFCRIPFAEAAGHNRQNVDGVLHSNLFFVQGKKVGMCSDGGKPVAGQRIRQLKGCRYLTV